jgi:hypothetical protein
MEIKHLLLALVVTSCIIGIAGFQNNIGSHYNVTHAKNLTYLNKAQETGEKISDISNTTNMTLLGKNTTFGQYIDPIVGYTIGTIKMFSIFLDIPGILFAFITQASDVMADAGIPMPAWFMGIIIAGITLTLIFAFIKFVRGSGEP